MNRWRRLLLWLAIGLGILRPLAFGTGFVSVSALVGVLNLSPLPLVFGRHMEVETVERRFRLLLEDESGSILVSIGGDDLYERLSGPFSRRKLYADQLGFLDLRQGRFQRGLIEDAFCAPGSLLPELGVEGRVETVRLVHWEVPGGPASGRPLEHRCP